MLRSNLIYVPIYKTKFFIKIRFLKIYRCSKTRLPETIFPFFLVETICDKIFYIHRVFDALNKTHR